MLTGQGNGTSSPDFTIDCGGAQQAIRRLEGQMPPAPDQHLQDLLSQLFAHKDRQYATCLAADQTTATAAARDVSRLRAEVQRYVAKKLGQGHSH